VTELIATTRVAILSGACAAVMTAGVLTTPASAVAPRTGQHVVTSPYAVALDALGGQTLAEYIAAHQAVDSRLARLH
jgi:hypothetical protein